jgi:hypothetical protein
MALSVSPPQSVEASCLCVGLLACLCLFCGLQAEIELILHLACHGVFVELPNV